VALAAAIEAKRVADLAAPWQAQLTFTDSALLTANTVVANATSVMNSDAELSSKTTAVEASITALLAVVKAVLVNANCVSQGAATSAASNALVCVCKV
jgi:hypothetical protein